MLFSLLAMWGLFYHHCHFLRKQNFAGNANGAQVISIHKCTS